MRARRSRPGEVYAPSTFLAGHCSGRPFGAGVCSHCIGPDVWHARHRHGRDDGSSVGARIDVADGATVATTRRSRERQPRRRRVCGHAGRLPVPRIPGARPHVRAMGIQQRISGAGDRIARGTTGRDRLCQSARSRFDRPLARPRGSRGAGRQSDGSGRTRGRPALHVRRADGQRRHLLVSPARAPDDHAAGRSRSRGTAHRA